MHLDGFFQRIEINHIINFQLSLTTYLHLQNYQENELGIVCFLFLQRTGFENKHNNMGLEHMLSKKDPIQKGKKKGTKGRLTIPKTKNTRCL